MDRGKAARRLALATLVALLPIADASPRSPAVKAEFRKANPCPSTGRTRGACPGWEVDHRHAMMCGGPDAVENLQWLTVEAHRAKTRIERRECRAGKIRSPQTAAAS
jgi:hypothetical protein